MLKNISLIICNYLIDKNYIDNGEKDVFEFGIEFIISQSILILILLILGFVFNKFLEILVFIISLGILRYFFDGIHASSFMKCIVLTLFSLAFNLITTQNIKYDYIFLGVQLILIITYLISKRKAIITLFIIHSFFLLFYNMSPILIAIISCNVGIAVLCSYALIDNLKFIHSIEKNDQ